MAMITESAEQLKPILGALSPSDRLGLAIFLYDSIETETLSAEDFQAEWEAELMRRVKETENGVGDEISGDEMRRLAREALQ
jgi:putative addiction module component (TIGR02574 family)